MSPRGGQDPFKYDPKVPRFPELFNSKQILFNRTIYKGSAHGELSILSYNKV
jgi:hypothetical protein